jgi:hypothetical protein
MIATPRPSVAARRGCLRGTYRASAARAPAPRTHGTKGMVSQKSNVAQAQMTLPTKTATEAVASRPEAATRTLF